MAAFDLARRVRKVQSGQALGVHLRWRPVANVLADIHWQALQKPLGPVAPPGAVTRCHWRNCDTSEGGGYGADISPPGGCERNFPKIRCHDCSPFPVARLRPDLAGSYVGVIHQSNELIEFLTFELLMCFPVWIAWPSFYLDYLMQSKFNETNCSAFKVQKN
jgi:hypothetical protein